MVKLGAAKSSSDQQQVDENGVHKVPQVPQDKTLDEAIGMLSDQEKMAFKNKMMGSGKDHHVDVVVVDYDYAADNQQNREVRDLEKCQRLGKIGFITIIVIMTVFAAYFWAAPYIHYRNSDSEQFQSAGSIMPLIMENPPTTTTTEEPTTMPKVTDEDYDRVLKETSDLLSKLESDNQLKETTTSSTEAPSSSSTEQETQQSSREDVSFRALWELTKKVVKAEAKRAGEQIKKVADDASTQYRTQVKPQVTQVWEDKVKPQVTSVWDQIRRRLGQ